MLTKKKLLKRIIDLEKRAGVETDMRKKLGIGLAATAGATMLNSIFQLNTRSAVRKNNALVLSKMDKMDKKLDDVLGFESSILGEDGDDEEGV